MNLVAFFHAYKFTHFTEPTTTKTNSPENLSKLQKLNTLFFGINNPRPENKAVPPWPYEVVKLKSNKEIDCWSIPIENSKGTVVLFHGFSGEKSSLIDNAKIFKELGYNTLLVDFMGSGNSEGRQTTIGYLEAQQVKTCFNYLSEKGEKNIYLFGTSMGAVAVMKALSDYAINPRGIILECPFGTMYKTVCARFKSMNAPTFPMAGLLVFWGGVQNGFWAFKHKPRDYAKKIKTPTLLLHGAKDPKVSLEEINTIFKNLAGEKNLKIFDQAGHENYLIKYQDEWKSNVKEFLNKEWSK